MYGYIIMKLILGSFSFKKLIKVHYHTKELDLSLNFLFTLVEKIFNSEGRVINAKILTPLLLNRVFFYILVGDFKRSTNEMNKIQYSLKDTMT
jgi:hypothetical protein